MKYLISKEMQKEYKKATGLDLTEEKRQTGRSTAIALETLAICIKNPESSIRIVDHHFTKEADRHLMERIYEITESLSLRGFTFNESNLTITFHLFEPLKRK